MSILSRASTTPASRLAILAALALVSSLALGACSAADPAPAPSTVGELTLTSVVPDPAAVQEAVTCPPSIDDFPSNSDPSYPSAPRGSVPQGFEPEKAFICLPDAADGNPGVQLKELQGDFAPLLKALAIPSDRATDGDKLVCPAIMEYISVLWLVNAKGESIDAAWPTTQCRQASGKPDTQKAIDGLTVLETKVVSESGK